MMNENYHSYTEADRASVIINGVECVLGDDNLYHPIETQPEDAAYQDEEPSANYEPQATIPDSKPNHRRKISLPTRLFMGAAAVGVVVVPAAVHMGTEQAANFFLDMANPTEDKTITQDELTADLNKSFDELVSKNIGRIIEGVR